MIFCANAKEWDAIGGRVNCLKSAIYYISSDRTIVLSENLKVTFVEMNPLLAC